MYSNNFGVIEVASARTTAAPGWAYVPDTSGGGVKALPSNRKRARNQGPNLTGADLSARQEAKVRRELEALDRDNNRDVHIPIPPKKGGAKASTKSTPNIRKILQSQKTFANHLDDYEALRAQNENNPPPHPNQHSQRALQPNQHGKSKTPHANQYTKRPPQPNQYTKRNAAAAAAAVATASASAPETNTSTKAETSRSRSRRSLKADPGLAVEPAIESEAPEVEARDVEMVDSSPAGAKPSSILTLHDAVPLPEHAGDDDPLLASVVPDLPTDEELQRLLAHPPLGYAGMRAAWTDEDRRYPVRVFCEVCGYWGRVRCMKCGTRLCALDCLDVHREECVTRYGL